MTTETLHPARRRTFRRLFGVWLALVAAFFLWEVAVFRGLFARGAAWQFGRIDEFWPTLTYSLLALLLALPPIVAGLVWYRRNRRHEASVGEIERRSLAIRRGRRVADRLHWTALVLAAAGVLSLLYSFTLPHGPAQPVNVSASIGGADPVEGAATLTNAVRGRGVSHHTQWLFFRYRTIRFAVVPLRDELGTLVPRYFIQLSPDEPNWPERGPASPTTRTGYLVRNGLPGPLEQMYRQRDYRLTEPYFVLYRDAPPVRHRYEVAASQIGLIAIAMLLVAWRQRRHVRRLENDEDAIARGVV